MAEKKEVELVIRSRSGSGLVEQKVRGHVFERDGRTMYHYQELESEMGRVTTTLKVDSGLIRLLRQGDIRSEQQFSIDRRLPGFYDTPHGRFELDTETVRLYSALHDGIGKLSWAYDLYMAGDYSGRIELEIEVNEV